MQINLYSIEAGRFKMDGGAMFGVVPKVLWEKMYPADSQNLVTLTMRSLLIEDIKNKRLILIDTGLGENPEEKILKYYYPDKEISLTKSLKKAGFEKKDITDVILTHLHFDHCGGAVEKNKDEEYQPAFPNAQYWLSTAQWDEGKNPNAREKASYMQNHFVPLKEAGVLNFIEGNYKLSENIELRLYHGHTPGQIIPFIQMNNQETLVYCADLIPVMSHIPLPYICAFDIEPLKTVKEKEDFLKEALINDYTLFFEHDIYNECCSLEKTEKGIRPAKKFVLDDFFMSR